MLRLVSTCEGRLSVHGCHGSYCSVVESLDEVFFDQIVPSVDLEVSVYLRHFGFDLVLVASYHELLGIISIVVRGVHDVTDLGNLPAISLLVFEIIDDPSKYTISQVNTKKD